MSDSRLSPEHQISVRAEYYSVRSVHVSALHFLASVPKIDVAVSYSITVV